MPAPLRNPQFLQEVIEPDVQPVVEPEMLTEAPAASAPAPKKKKAASKNKMGQRIQKAVNNAKDTIGK